MNKEELFPICAFDRYGSSLVSFLPFPMSVALCLLLFLPVPIELPQPSVLPFTGFFFFFSIIGYMQPRSLFGGVCDWVVPFCVPGFFFNWRFFPSPFRYS